MTVKIVQNYLIPTGVLNDAYRTPSGTVAVLQDGTFYMADEPGHIRWPDRPVLTRSEVMALANEMLPNVTYGFAEEHSIEIAYRLLLDESVIRLG